MNIKEVNKKLKEMICEYFESFEAVDMERCKQIAGDMEEFLADFRYELDRGTFDYKGSTKKEQERFKELCDAYHAIMRFTEEEEEDKPRRRKLKN